MLGKNKILIVSNNPLSYTKNNGKTIASFIKDIPRNQVRQLYFSNEKPSYKGYSYFSISDKNIIDGYILKKKRGEEYNDDSCIHENSNQINTQFPIKKNAFMRVLREILWHGHWQSPQLIKWLDEFSPDVVFFVAGDSGFAYKIVKFIIERYSSRLVTYITDDYIIPSPYDSVVEKKRKNYIRKNMLECINLSSTYLTISEEMQNVYEKISGKKSSLIMNITPSLRIEDGEVKEDKNYINFIYAGSLYYNRDKTLGYIADAVSRYNSTILNDEKPIRIKVYSNTKPDEKTKETFERDDVCKFYGSLNYEKLKEEFNKADVLLFVESFDNDMIDKIKYSLSTKVPEYMSVGKPIFAVGPDETGSIEYLKDIAFFATNEQDIYSVLFRMMSSPKMMEEKGYSSLEKYNSLHNEEKQRQMITEILLKNDRGKDEFI